MTLLPAKEKTAGADDATDLNVLAYLDLGYTPNLSSNSALISREAESSPALLEAGSVFQFVLKR